MNSSQLAKFIVSFFAIKEDIYIINEIIEDLEDIKDLQDFKDFIKTKFNYEKYRFLNGFGRFTAMRNDYLKDNEPKLSDEQYQMAYSYSEKLFSRTTSCFDEVDFLVQTGNDLTSQKVKAVIFNFFNGREKDIKVLKQIGDKKKLLTYIQTNRKSLEDKIMEVVVRLSLLKSYPNIGNDKKESVRALEVIKKGIEKHKGEN
jgi:hypothetical protein